MVSPKLSKIPSGGVKEDKIAFSKSLNSDAYNNSTDDDMKAPILGKSEFKQIMESKPFER